MKTRAAILWEQGKPLSVEEVDLDAPGPGEVLVEVKTAGVCHSDLHPARGDWPMKTPVILGHEGAGIVREVGEGVTSLVPGDHVVFCWAPACGSCPPCREGKRVLCDRLAKTTYRNLLPAGITRLSARGQAIAPFLSTACFAGHTVVAAEGAVRVPREEPFELLAVLGCAVVTGVGAILNNTVPPESNVAVIGVGGVGLNVVQGAVIRRAKRIIAIDRQPPALALARSFGASDTLIADENTAKAVRALTDGRGADYVIDTVGSPETLNDALAAARKGGTVIITGLSRLDAKGAVPMYAFVMQEKRLIGSVYGSRDPVQDIPQLVNMYQEGKLKLRELVARTYTLDQINDALDALASSAAARGIIVM